MPGFLETEAHLTIITGHYGVGKTNLALNLVRDLRQCYHRVTLIDLDIVNPYFRSSDNADYLRQIDVGLLGPVFGGTNLDTPSLSPGIDAHLAAAGPQHAVVVDVGGDPDGARALARFREAIDSQPHLLLYIVNQQRLQTQDAQDALDLLREIEAISRLAATGIVGNSHLKAETTLEGILDSVPYALKIARDADLPLTCVTAPRDLAAAVRDELEDRSRRLRMFAEPIPVYPLDILVRTPWE